jgi:YVTN family beta-propeller protein
MTRIPVLALAAALVMVLGVVPSRAQNAYITNQTDGTVSVIDTATGTVVGSPITVGAEPIGAAVTPDGSAVYVANNDSSTVSVISTATNAVIAVSDPSQKISIPFGVAVTADGSTAYVTNQGTNSIAVISTANNTVTGTISDPSFNQPSGVAVTPDGSQVYVTNRGTDTVSVIATATNAVSAITVGSEPSGVAVTPDGSTVYVANSSSSSVSVIATATNTVTGSPITVGHSPYGVAVTPDGTTVYVGNQGSNTVSAIDTATTTVTPISGGSGGFSLPSGVAVTPNGSQVYVTNYINANVSVIATASNTVIGNPISVGHGPQTIGQFIVPAHTLTVREAGTGSGQVTSGPVGINCDAGNTQCAFRFAGGTQVTLIASAAAGSTFSGWSGGGCSGTGTCVVTLKANTTVTASFAAQDFTLSVSTVGRGVVGSAPAGIDCGKTCRARFAAGTKVGLEAFPDSGWEFDEWRGACHGKNKHDCHVTMDAAEGVIAKFEKM